MPYPMFPVRLCSGFREPGDVLAVFPFDCELVRFGVCGDDSGVGAALNAKFLAPSGVVENVGGLVERSPVTVGAGRHTVPDSAPPRGLSRVTCPFNLDSR
jgi:hypothetical protein